MKNKTKTIAISISILCIIVILFLFFTKNSSSDVEEVSTESIYAVETMIIEEISAEAYLTYSAMIQPSSTEQATFTTIGTITAIHVEEGDLVTEGQLLITLDSTQVDNQIDSYYEVLTTAQSNLDSASKNLEEAQDEYDQAVADKEASKEEYEEEISNAEDNLATAEEALNYFYNSFPTDSPDGDTTDDTTDDDTSDNLNADDYEANITAAQDALQNLQDDYEDEQDDYDVEIQLLESKVSSAQYAYDTAEASYTIAKSNYNTATSSLDDYTYEAQMDGEVVMIVSSVGSVATPLSPVLVIASHSLEAQFGISSNDISEISIGNQVDVTIKGEIYNGEITAISALPDDVSRTYLVDIAIDTPPDDALIGELVSVKIATGEAAGIWIPISIIMNDITDYVYVVENSRVVRKDIEILELEDNLVMVSGLNAGDEVITSNMTNVKSGYLVTVQSEDN